MAENQIEPGLLTASISELPVSENFYLRSKLMGYSSIGQIIATPPGIILAKEEFNYRWMGELIRLLMSHNMLHKWQSLPGSNAC